MPPYILPRDYRYMLETLIKSGQHRVAVNSLLINLYDGANSMKVAKKIADGDASGLDYTIDLYDGLKNYMNINFKQGAMGKVAFYEKLLLLFNGTGLELKYQGGSRQSRKSQRQQRQSRQQRKQRQQRQSRRQQRQNQ